MLFYLYVSRCIVRVVVSLWVNSPLPYLCAPVPKTACCDANRRRGDLKDFHEQYTTLDKAQPRARRQGYQSEIENHGVVSKCKTFDFESKRDKEWTKLVLSLLYFTIDCSNF